jgi:ABC-type Fe3+-siderophore transport system, permease component
MPKTVVGMFDTFNEAQACVRDLENSGFTKNDISVVASEAAQKLDTGTVDTGTTSVGSGAATGATIGAVGGGALGLLAGLGLFAIPGLGPILAAGPLVATLTGAGIGAATGGVIGALVGMGVPKEEADVYAEGIRRGGTMVTVQTPSDADADRAVNIMNRHNVVDIESGQRLTGARASRHTTQTQCPLPPKRSSGSEHAMRARRPPSPALLLQRGKPFRASCRARPSGKARRDCQSPKRESKSASGRCRLVAFG